MTHPSARNCLVAAAAAFLVNVALAPDVFGQTSSAQPPEPSAAATSRETSATMREWAEKQEERYSRFSEHMDRLGLSPKFGTLGQGSGLAAGALYHRDSIGPAPMDLEGFAGFSIRGYQQYELRAGMLRDRELRTTIRPADTPVGSQFDTSKDRAPGFGVYADIRYRHSPLHRFFGIGVDSNLEDKTSFLLRGASYDIVTEYQPRKWVGFAVRGGLLDLTVGPGGSDGNPTTETLFTDATAPGLGRQPKFFHLGTAMTLDGRDSAAAPRSGGMLGVMLSRFDGRGGSEADFWRVASDARYFVPASARSVVALRLLTSSDHAGHGARVPFYLQQPLGGGDTLRGFDRARFRDTSLLLMSGEYRFDVHPAIELAGFVDAGQVAPKLGSLSFARFESNWGGGVRWKSKSKRMVKFRVDYAVSSTSRHLILSASPAF